MQNAQERALEVTIIGGGIVGLCVAYYLTEVGLKVQIIEPLGPGGECSSGNAGSLSSGSVAPLAMPGVLKQAANMLLDPAGPVYIPTSYLLHLAPWMARFVASARPKRVAEIAHSLHNLIGNAVQEHKSLAEKAGCLELIVETGQLHLYPDQQAFDKDNAAWELKKKHGLNLIRVGRSDIQRLEPSIGPEYQMGYFLPDQPWVKDPYAYALSIFAYLETRGVKVIKDKVQSLIRSDAGWVLEGERQDYVTPQVVVAAGAWSAKLLSSLGFKVPLETQRGYHLSYSHATGLLQRIVVLADRKVFITPMQNGLRAAGTVEFGGLERFPSSSRARLLGDHAKAALPKLDINNPIEWMGHRPCLPDSLPVLGELPNNPGLWCAFGHGHLGLTGAAGTGRLLAEAITGSQKAQAKLAAFSASRFDLNYLRSKR